MLQCGLNSPETRLVHAMKSGQTAQARSSTLFCELLLH